MTDLNVTVDDWERSIGAQIRAARVSMQWDQAELARRSNISVASLSTLERGLGSTLKTLISVIRALGRTEWLSTLAPTNVVSPMAMLRAQRSARTPMRVRSRRRPTT